MAEGFDASHVPQQSRRDKLRIFSHPHPPNLLPVYNPSLLQVPADLLTCPITSTTSSFVKEETSSTLVGFASNRSCNLPVPPSSSSENPSHFQDANPSFLCTQHDLGNAREWGYSSFSGNNGQGLSLSLSSRVNSHGNDDVQRNLPFELNLERYESLAAYGCDKGSGNGSGNGFIGEVPGASGPLGPFTGYSMILRGSRFLKPAQKLLEELCDVGRGMFFSERETDAESSLMEGGGESVGNAEGQQRVGSGDGGELGGEKSRLIALLDEVCRRYMHYYQQLQDVVASFECVAGLGNAAPYVNLALKAMARHFRCLKDAIVDQLHFTSKVHEKSADTRDNIVGFGTIERTHIGQRAVRNSGYLQQQPVWRPQRGLPERAVTVLRAWLFEHFLHPYPTDTDKLMLAKQTGLSRCQVSNWFINARVRLWKPMVEEIHTLETQQMQASHITCRDERSITQTSTDHPQLLSSVPSASNARLSALATDLSTVRNEQVRHLSHVAVGESIGRATSSGVTLTLGLHHQRLGMAAETTGEGNVMGGYVTQDWQLGRDVCGGTWPAASQ